MPVSWTCPLCTRVTFHPVDVRERYCPCCGNALLPKNCDHRPNLKTLIDQSDYYARRARRLI